MTGLQSFSLSVWYWQVSQPVASPNSPEGIFFLADANGADPLIILENEPGAFRCVGRFFADT